MLGTQECVAAAAKARPQRRPKIGSGRRESRVLKTAYLVTERAASQGEITVILAAPRDFVVLSLDEVCFPQSPTVVDFTASVFASAIIRN